MELGLEAGIHLSEVVQFSRQTKVCADVLGQSEPLAVLEGLLADTPEMISQPYFSAGNRRPSSNPSRQAGSTLHSLST